MLKSDIKPLKKPLLRRRFSNALIIVGIALILAFFAYECATYPWVALFARWGWVTPEIPGDPPPLPILSGADLDEKSTWTDQDGKLPDQPGLTLQRPPVYLKNLGIIKIPAMSLSENIVEGQGDELLYAVGHSPGSALPGQEGNCFLSGHRNYILMRPFRYLNLLGVDDLVYIIDEENTYTYQAFEVFAVTADDVWVMDPVQGETHVLTLMTCTPVINPADRLIVRCRLIETTPKMQ